MLTDEQARELARAYDLRYIGGEAWPIGGEHWTWAFFVADPPNRIVYSFDSADSVEAALAAKQARRTGERNCYA